MNSLITGANRGLGLELVREAMEREYQVIATCRSLSRELNMLAEEYPAQIRIENMDVGSWESVSASFERISGNCTGLNGIINNAAVLYGSKYDTSDPITEANLEQYRDTLNINLLGPVRVLKAFMPLVYAAQEDRFVANITTSGAKLSPTGHQYPAYAASKSGLNGYTQRMRNYLSTMEEHRDIRVLMIHPGQMDTAMGAENAQIHPSVAAKGIWDLVVKRKDLNHPIPFYDYLGNHLQ